MQHYYSTNRRFTLSNTPAFSVVFAIRQSIHQNAPAAFMISGWKTSDTVRSLPRRPTKPSDTLTHTRGREIIRYHQILKVSHCRDTTTPAGYTAVTLDTCHVRHVLQTPGAAPHVTVQQHQERGLRCTWAEKNGGKESVLVRWRTADGKVCSKKINKYESGKKCIATSSELGFVDVF